MVSLLEVFLIARNLIGCIKENFVIYIYSDQSSETISLTLNRIGYSLEIQVIHIDSQDSSE